MRVYVMIYFDLDPGAAAAGAPIFNGWAGCMPEWMWTGDSWREVANIECTFFDPGKYNMVGLHGLQ